ncbi:MAG: DUF5004 domain-containing protein [Bacteroidota bacterium]
MKQLYSYCVLLFFIFFSTNSCTKNSEPNGQRTVANIAGTYQLVGFTKTINDTTYNAFDTMSVCKKGNLVQFNTDMTVNYTNSTGTCTFPPNRTGTWHLDGDYIYLDDDALKIKNFNGKTLALTSISMKDPGVINFITWVKK